MRNIFNNENMAEVFSELVNIIVGKFGNDYQNLPMMAKMVTALYSMDLELDNGGFHQFLSNSSGDFSEDIKKFLGTIGAVKTLDIFLKLSSKFTQNEIPTDRAIRNEVLDMLEDSDPEFDFFNTEDKEYRYNRDKDENILMILKSYLTERLEDFENIFNEYESDNVSMTNIENIEKHLSGAEDELNEILRFYNEKSEKEFIQRIKVLLSQNERLEAIKAYRKEKQCSLNEAKKAIDILANEIKPR